MLSAKCPECGETVRLPSVDLPPDSSAECPWCAESVSAQRWLDTLPPVIKVIGADGQPISFDSHHDGNGSGPGGGHHPGGGQLPLDSQIAGGSAGAPADHSIAGFPAVNQTSESPDAESTDTVENPFAFSNAALAAGGAAVATGAAVAAEAGLLSGDDDQSDDLELNETASGSDGSQSEDDSLVTQPVHWAPSTGDDELAMEEGGTEDTGESFLKAPGSTGNVASAPLPALDDPAGLEFQSAENLANPGGQLEESDLANQLDTAGAPYTDSESDLDDTADNFETLIQDSQADQTESAQPHAFDDGEGIGDTANTDSPHPDEQGDLVLDRDSDADIDSDDATVDFDSAPITGHVSDETKQKVPVSPDQRSYYQRHPPRRKRKSPLKQVIAYVLGGVASVPIAGAILLALGKAPNLGFAPFDGSIEGLFAANRTAAALPASLDPPSTDSDNESASETPTAPSFERTLVPKESDVAQAGQEALTVEQAADADDDETLSASDFGKRQISSDQDDASMNADELESPSEDVSKNDGAMTIDLDNLVVGEMDDPAGDATDLPETDLPETDDDEASKNAPKDNVSDMLLVFPSQTPTPPTVAELAEIPVKPAEKETDLTPMPEPEIEDPVETGPENSGQDIAAAETSKLRPATVEAAKPAIDSGQKKVSAADDAEKTAANAIDNSSVKEKSPPRAPRTTVTPATPSRATPSESPELVKVCENAMEVLRSFEPRRSAGPIDQRSIAKAFMQVSKVGGFVGTKSSPSIVSLLDQLETLPELSRFGEVGSDWLRYSKRKTEGVILVGRPGSNLAGQTITLADDTVVPVLLPGKAVLPSAEQLVAIGRIVKIDGKQKVELVAARSVR